MENLKCACSKDFHALSDHTAWKAVETVEIGAGPFRELKAGDEGHVVMLQNWIDNESGILCAKKTGHEIVFNVNQFWDQVRDGVRN